MAKLSVAFMTAMVISLGLAAVHGQESARGRKAAAAPLSPQDYLDIQQLLARYAFAVDSGADNGRAYAALFTDDGEFILPSGPIKGPEALAEFGRSGFVDGHKPANGVAHFIVNNVVEPSPVGATGKQYVVLVKIGEDDKPGGEFSEVGGHYEDVYAKTTQGWKFKRREFIPMKFERRPARGSPAR
jgi:hypothetical protein